MLFENCLCYPSILARVSLGFVRSVGSTDMPTEISTIALPRRISVSKCVGSKWAPVMRARSPVEKRLSISLRANNPQITVAPKTDSTKRVRLSVIACKNRLATFGERKAKALFYFPVFWLLAR